MAKGWVTRAYVRDRAAYGFFGVFAQADLGAGIGELVPRGIVCFRSLPPTLEGPQGEFALGLGLSGLDGGAVGVVLDGLEASLRPGWALVFDDQL